MFSVQIQRMKKFRVGNNCDKGGKYLIHKNFRILNWDIEFREKIFLILYEYTSIYMLYSRVKKVKILKVFCFTVSSELRLNYRRGLVILRSLLPFIRQKKKKNTYKTFNHISTCATVQPASLAD